MDPDGAHVVKPGSRSGPRSRPTVAGRRAMAFVLLLALASGAAVGCGGRRDGSLEAVRKHGELRVAVRPGFLDGRTGAGEDEQAVLLRHLADRLGVDLRWVEVGRHDRLLETVEAGRADVAVSRFSAADLIGSECSPSAPVEWVDDYLVAAGAMPALTLEDLRGGEVHVQPSVLGPSLESAVVSLGLEVVPASERLSLEELVVRVRDHDIPLTLADARIVERVPGARRLQLLGPIASRRPVVWAIPTRHLGLRRAVDDFLFADQVLARRKRTAACRDLPEIRAARVLRVVTRNSRTTCYVDRGGLAGFEYELAVRFARGERLRLELVIPPPDVDPLDWLERGYGDLAVLHEPLAPSLSGRFAASRPYRNVDLVAVMGRGAEADVAVEDLAGRAVAAAPPVAELVALLPVNPPITARPAAPGTDSFTALLAVARGEAAVAVVDADAARLELEERGELRRGPVVVPDVPLVWVLNPSSPILRQRVNRFLRETRASGLVQQLVRANLGGWRRRLPSRLPEVPEGDLTPYDEVLRWAGRRNGIDWRLLASLMYEESRFDPDAVGPGGSAGLFQFMPSTWAELGIEDPHHPGEAIEAGARYLRQLMDKFPDLELPDRVAMAIASYNVGPRHVFDARRLASEMGFDPDRWAGNVETAMVILDDPEVARLYPAGVCNCRRGAAYTRRILRRYLAYTEQFPPA